MARVQMPRKQVDQLDELVNDQVKSPQLTDNERKVFSLLKERDQVNTGYIAQQLNLSYSTVKRVLRTLKQRDMIYRVGSDKSGYWRIKE
ncbi:MAG: HTH domain-containing protein, partial [Bacteroidales bacterium]|nr:HTH domain-containing protein [Bacteroidales bacterium]MBR4497689.1 HTH domain-containing protein [Bacteroidales bacterium]